MSLAVAAPRATRRRPVPSRPVERPTSKVRTTRPDVFTFDSTRLPRPEVPKVDVRKTRRIGGVGVCPVAFAAEIPLQHAVWLQRNFDSHAAISAFLSFAVMKAAGNPRKPATVRTDYELYVLVKIQTVIPARSLKSLCDVYPDVHELASIIGIAVTAAVESRLADGKAVHRGS